jgi:hypothetical protein
MPPEAILISKFGGPDGVWFQHMPESIGGHFSV